MDLQIECIAENDATIPTRAKQHDAGYDLYAHIKDEGRGASVIIPPGGRALIKTGVKLAIPEGFVGMVCPRSGLASKNGVTVLNAPGILDAGYRGDVGVILVNLGDTDFVVENEMRVAQLVFVSFLPANFIRVQSLGETDRGSGGFGSTG